MSTGDHTTGVRLTAFVCACCKLFKLHFFVKNTTKFGQHLFIYHRHRTYGTHSVKK